MTSVSALGRGGRGRGQKLLDCRVYLACKMADALHLWTRDTSGVLLPSCIDSIPPEQRRSLVQRPYFDTVTNLDGSPKSKKISPVCAPPNQKRPALTQGERLMFEHHDAIRDRMIAVHAELLQMGRHSKVFERMQKEASAAEHDGSVTPVQSIPLPSRMFYSLDLRSVCELQKLVPHTPGTPPAYLWEPACRTDDAFGHVVINSSGGTVTLEAMGARFSIPQGSTFLMSDAARLEPLVEHCNAHPTSSYDVVVLDPPWWNRSVRRSNKYPFLTSKEISELPLPSILADGALVVVWTTNSRTLVESIKDSLFSNWSVQFVAEWQWLKVTTSGEMVIDLESVHRKPYETLVVGIHKKCLHKPECTPGEAGKVRNGSVFEVPHQLIVCSVPTVHSQKPFLGAAIDRCLNGDKGCKGELRIYDTVSEPHTLSPE